MAASPSIRVVKTFPFKGGLKTYSNRYHFNGGTPADPTHWHTLMDNVVLAEKALYPSSCVIVECLGYAAGSDVPVAIKVYTTAGTYSAGGTDHFTPLQTAALIRWSTAARSTKNHPIYCFAYIRPCFYDDTASYIEKLSTAQKAAMASYATAWISGFSDGSITAVRASPNGAACTGSVVEEYLTHRDFPYSTSV